MQGRRVFITGGAGFIGSRLAKALTGAGAEVVVYDNLHPQVHGDAPTLDLAARLVVGDVRDGDAMAAALREAEPDTIVHLAAETGTGQSATEPTRYVDVNVGGTARLIEAAWTLPRQPRRMVLAASRAMYGEGAYTDAEGRAVVPEPRGGGQMASGVFALLDAGGRPLAPAPTPETSPPMPGSVYGATKLMQEYLLKNVVAEWDLVTLRLQNVYGPGQSLRNPYTGVLSIFCQQALAGRELNIYEDGEIYRDFVFVDDVVSAFVMACGDDAPAGRTLNVGTGRAISIRHAAVTILEELGLGGHRHRVSGDFRAGDVRYAVADCSAILASTSWRPEVSFEEGARRLVAWAREEYATI